MVETSISQSILRIKTKPSIPTEPIPVSQPVPRPLGSKKKPGRNDPCPCGKMNPKTGKPMKYKKCCWPKYG